MGSRGYRGSALRIHRIAVIVWTLAGFLAVVLVVSVLAWKNPWKVRTIDAGNTSAQELESIAKSHTPYVEMKDIDLTFTGFYETSEDDSICSYCYMGTIGSEHILIDMPVTDDGALASDGSAEGSVIKSADIRGCAVISDNMKKWLAEDEDLSLDDYCSKYSVSSAEFHVYHSDQERIRIYQAMILVVAAGLAATGIILEAEARTAGSEEQR